MKYYDLYGFIEDELDKVSAKLETLLNLKFEKHESFFWGEYDLSEYPKPGDGQLMLRYNAYPMDDEPAEVDFPEFSLLLDAENIPEPIALALEAMLLQEIAGVRLLRRLIRK